MRLQISCCQLQVTSSAANAGYMQPWIRYNDPSEWDCVMPGNRTVTHIDFDHPCGAPLEDGYSNSPFIFDDLANDAPGYHVVVRSILQLGSESPQTGTNQTKPYNSTRLPRHWAIEFVVHALSVRCTVTCTDRPKAHFTSRASSVPQRFNIPHP